MSIVDVDFRYVKSARDDIDPPVLQWRKEVSCYGGEWTEWTEWQDVRTEEE